MDLRSLPPDLTPPERCQERLQRIESELGIDLSSVAVNADTLGHAEEKNCENMFGHVPLPVGLAGPLSIAFSSGEEKDVFLPLATTEGALVASVNRGCKAAGRVTVTSEYVGMSRSIAFRIGSGIGEWIDDNQSEWKEIGQSTSSHLKIVSYDLDESSEYLFLTINCDTDEAMGMNMVTIAAQAIGNFIVDQCEGVELVTIAGNVDSDKKPSKRTKEKGRGYSVTAEALIPREVIETVLKTTPEAMLAVADAKLTHGSQIAGALGSNLHVANVIAAVYLATGQDAAHTVEGSLADTILSRSGDSEIAAAEGMKISVHLPAILIGVRGGGTVLPAQKQCLDLLLQPETTLHTCRQLAESVGAAVLAGELSLLAAQAGQHLASAHGELGR